MIFAHLKTPGKIIQGYAGGEDLQPYMFTHETNKGYGNSLTAPVDIVTEEYAEHLRLSLCETVEIYAAAGDVHPSRPALILRADHGEMLSGVLKWGYGAYGKENTGF